MNHKSILSLLVLVVILCGNAFSQELKIRLGGNYGQFSKEVGKKEVEHPLVSVLSNPNATDFTYNFEPGFDGEAMLFWNSNVETGIEVKYSKFSGNNEIPPYYNYYFAPDNPTVITTTEPLLFETSALSFLLNFRYYLASEGKINPYFRAFAGLSSVATEFNYQDLSVWDEGEAGVIYSAGTKDSENPKESALHYGAGFGINFGVSDKVSVYIDGTASVINSDIVDGIPNYDYIEADQTMERINGGAMFYQISLGIVFDTGINLGLNKNAGDKKGKGLKRNGRTTPYRPFYRQK